MEIKTKTDPHCSFAHDEQVFVELSPEKCLLIGREHETVGGDLHGDKTAAMSRQ